MAVVRYIEVFEANPLDVNRSRDGGGRGGGYGRDERRGHARGYTVTLRGLPYRSSEREIADWLSEAADPLEVIIEMERWVAAIVIQLVIWSVIWLFRTKSPNLQDGASERAGRRCVRLTP